MTLPRIAIIGGGPGGLTLARLLQVKNIPFILYELDDPHAPRSQGGTLDIHTATGQKALTEAGLYPTFQKHARKEGAALKILDKDGTVCLEGGDEAGDDRPEIDRNTLRTILLESLEEGAIKWGKKVVRISEGPASTRRDPKFDIEFEDGSVEQDFDLVVGADGAWSRARNLLTDAKPFYSGVTYVEFRIHDAEKYPDISQRVGMGSCFQCGDSRALISQRNGDGSIRTYAMVHVPEDWSTTCGIDWKNSKSSSEGIIEMMYKDWDSLGQRVVLQSDSEAPVVRPLYMLPVETKWITRPGVTMIGDAAHLMTPFAGVGVNLALIDALDLSHAIHSHVEGGVDWETALGEFEEKMFTRGAMNAKLTFNNLNIMFSGKNGREVAKKLGEAMAWEEGKTI